MSTTPYDFSRSFLQWTSTGVHHTPRLQVEAACRVTRDGESIEFFLGAACAGETMYAPRDLIQQPAYDFLMICAPGDQFMFAKLHADEALNIIEAHRVGGTMSTHSRRGSQVLDMTVTMARHAASRELIDHEQVREAIQTGERINGQTIFDLPGELGGSTRVEMTYPVKVCNVSHDVTRWQVDTGPVLVPALPATGDASADDADDLPVSRMRVGYLVFNDWDWAELAVRRFGAEPEPSGGSHFRPSERIACRHHLHQVD